ncbi:IclR family transcriptional regulator [Roseinatronobacter sp. NSM]|uniref:IclR family transcriptional regulator n=1 Tax=Roseinatronobacter sp. NSM TaxID=3457785 RepID=UPI004035A8B0
MSGQSSLDKLIAILDLFTEDHLEWTPDALMKATGYARPTLYRYLKTMKEAGLLTSLPGAGLTLGPRVVEMDYLMRKSDPLVHHGRPHLEALTATWPATALLVRWYGRRLLCIDSEVSTRDPLSSYPRGRPMPLARGAISRSIMAFLPRKTMMAMIEENLSDLHSIGLGATPPEIAESLKQVRKQGYAIAYGEVTPGVVGIAAPVFDAASTPIASLCMTIAGNLIASDKLDQISDRIRQSADEISEKLGRIRATDTETAGQDTPLRKTDVKERKVT